MENHSLTWFGCIGLSMFILYACSCFGVMETSKFKLYLCVSEGIHHQWIRFALQSCWYFILSQPLFTQD